jgi:ribosomal protein S18 acetylase RimI-like enzyme
MNCDKIIIRHAEEKDIKAAVAIAIDAWIPIREVFKKELGEEIYHAFFKNWKAEKEAEVSAELKSGNGFVTISDNKVVGFISYKIDSNGNGTIGTNAVHKDYRRRGISSMMYNHVLECLKKKGVSFVKVITGGDEGHLPARIAYEKVGFTSSLPFVCYYKKL